MSFKKKMTLYIFGTATALVIISTLLVLQQFIEFKSYETKLQALLKNSDPENINPPQQLKIFIDITHEKGTSLEAGVARRLLSRLDLSSNQRMIAWHPKYFLWSIFVDAEFSQDEIYSLYCAFSFNGVDYGAERLARRMFNKNLGALSEDEMATVASILWSPLI